MGDFLLGGVLFFVHYYNDGKVVVFFLLILSRGYYSGVYNKTRIEGIIGNIILRSIKHYNTQYYYNMTCSQQNPHRRRSIINST